MKKYTRYTIIALISQTEDLHITILSVRKSVIP